MMTNPVFDAVVLATALLAAGAATQTNQQMPVPAAPAAPAMAPAPDEIIYLPQLPAPAELANAAAAQGITVQGITRTSAQVTLIYRGTDGQVHLTLYQLLPAAGGIPTAAPTTLTAVPAAGGYPMAASPVLTAVPTASPTVVYAAPTPACYCDSSYYPWPLLESIAFGVSLISDYFDFDGGFRHFGGPGFRNFGTASGFRHFGGNPGFRSFGAASGFRYFGGSPGFRHFGGSPGLRHLGAVSSLRHFIGRSGFHYR